MAYLNKRQYEYRKRSAQQRNDDNTSIACSNGMTEEQADLINELCALRHEFHTNMDKVVVDDCGGPNIKARLVDLNTRIEESGLPHMEFIPTGEDEYIDIDSIYELRELFDVGWPEPGTEECQKRYDDEYHRISGELNELHTKIENYLADIDKTYKTHWCPTGFNRK